MARLRALCGAAALALVGHGGAAAPRWDQFHAFLWHSDLPPAALAALPQLGITAGVVFGQREAMDPAALRAAVAVQQRAGLATMVENIATDYYAPYHRFRKGVPINAAWLDLLARYRAHPADQSVWRREPGLADPAAFAPIQQRLTAHARTLAGSSVLYLSLGDETGIADLSAASDLDQGEPVLGAWRAALQRRYGTLAALNAAWHADVADWAALTPTSTDAALAGTGPVAGWLDFHAWMDGVFAQAVGDGTAAVHAGDPDGLAAIEGGQRPGWGGYDYATLAGAVDVLEAGEPDPAFALARSFNPRLILLTTVVPDAAAAHQLWHSALLGGRGAVIWDEDGVVVRPDGEPGPGAAALAPALTGLRGPLGTALIAARPEPSRVGVLYSQASFQMRWLLDRRAERAAGQDWTTRDNDVDLADSPWRTALTAAGVALDHLGMHADYLDAASLTPERVAALGTLVLPQSILLSEAAVAVLRQFAAGGGLILADAEPGRFDEWGGTRAAPPLAGLGQRVSMTTAALREALHAPALVIAADGVPREDVSAFRFDGGRMMALQADSAAAAGPATIVVAGQRCAVTLDAAEPAILVSASNEPSLMAADGRLRPIRCGATGQ